MTLLMGGQTEAAWQLLTDAQPDGGLMAFDQAFRQTYAWYGNAAVSMATILRMTGDPEQAMAYEDLYDKWWSNASDDGTVAIAGYSASQAMLHALRGNHQQALANLKKAHDERDVEFRMFMHPVFNEIRNEPAYRTILENWMAWINKERIKLGLPPLELNDEVGPGVTPFNLDKRNFTG